MKNHLKAKSLNMTSVLWFFQMIFQIFLQHVKRTRPRNDPKEHAQPAELKAFVNQKHHSREDMQRHSFGSFLGVI